MSGMLASRVCFGKILPMFVLLASLILAKCLSGTAADTSPSFGSEDSKSTVPTGSHPTPASSDIKSTSLATALASSTSSVSNITDEHAVNNATDLHSVNSSIKISPENKTSTISLNNSTTASTMSSIEASMPTHSKSTTETDATKSTSATTEKSKEITSTTGAVSSPEENAKEDDFRHAAEGPSSESNSSGHSRVNSSQIIAQPVSSNSSEGNKTTVSHQSSKMTNPTSVRTPTTASHAVEPTLSPVNSEVTSTTSENATTSTTYVELTTPSNGAGATASGLLLATWLVARAVA